MAQLGRLPRCLHRPHRHSAWFRSARLLQVRLFHKGRRKLLRCAPPVVYPRNRSVCQQPTPARGFAPARPPALMSPQLPLHAALVLYHPVCRRWGRPIVGNVGNANAGARGSMGRSSGVQRLPRLPFAAQSVAENNVVRGAFGSGQAATSTPMGAGGRAMGVGATGAARGATARASAAKGAAVKSANVFTFNKADRDYFTRQFMGRKKKTVRKVIAGR